MNKVQHPIIFTVQSSPQQTKLCLQKLLRVRPLQVTTLWLPILWIIKIQRVANFTQHPLLNIVVNIVVYNSV